MYEYIYKTYLNSYMFENQYIYIYIDFQTCMNIYIRLIIYSYFYLFKYSTNKHHRKLCIYTHRI